MKGKEILYIESHANLLPSMTQDGTLHRTNNYVFWSDIDNNKSLSITNVTAINLCAWRNDIDSDNSVEFKRYVRRSIRQIIKIRVVRRWDTWIDNVRSMLGLPTE